MPTSTQQKERTANRSPKGVYKGTREEYLEDAALIMGDWINEFITIKDIKEHNKNRIPKSLTLKRFKLSDNRFRCGLTSSRSDYRMKHAAIGQIHYSHSTGNKVNEIVISNRLNGKGTKIQSSVVAHVLLHEMIHACTPYHGHKGEFKRLARALEMDGKLTATENSQALEDRIIQDVVNPLGKFPHKAVTTRTSRKGSRLLKITCTECDIVFRASKKVCKRLDEQECVGCLTDGRVHPQGYLVCEGV